MNMTNKREVKCMFCQESDPKYNCPRCLLHYCSVKCFQHKSHEKCSESFYKEQVLDQLKDMKGSREEQERMLDLLKRAKRDNDRDDGGGVADIGDRLEDIDLDDTDNVWERLTPQEKETFQKYVTKGDLPFVPVWIPWWTSEKSRKIEEISLEKKQSSKNLPKLMKDLPQLNDVLRDKSPDANLKFCLIEILLTYCCTQRVFNGDLFDSHAEAVSLIFFLSKILSENKVYSDVDSCVHCFITTVRTSSDLNIDPVEVVLKDVHQILMGCNSFLVRALSDFYIYLKKCSKYLRKDDRPLSQQLFVASKKIYFYVLYSIAHEPDIKALGSRICTLREELLRDKDMTEKRKEIIEENYDKLRPSSEKKLIEEI